jgi:dTDP-4-amino-4,6-dideoxygalactose transaminase
MTWKIPLSDIDLNDEEIDAVSQVLKSKWLTMGPITKKFEDAFANYLGIKHAFAVSNGTAALHIANKVLGIQSGDEVIMPSLTFVATANSTLYTGGKPVFAEVTSNDNFNISPDDIQKRINSKTKAITVVHYGGYPCEMDVIMEIATENDLKVIEDAAHAPGAGYKRKKCGTIGDVGCFSFFSNKNLVTGEGGMIVTNEDALADKIRIIRSHAMTTLTWDRHKGQAKSYDIVDLGFNYRTNEMASALGLAQLKKLDKNNQRRKEFVEQYRTHLEGIMDITIPFKDHKQNSSYHIFPILLSRKINRTMFQNKLKDNGIQTSIHYPPVHRFKYYQDKFGYTEDTLPITEFVSEHEVTLPLHPLMNQEIIKFISDTIRDISQ